MWTPGPIASQVTLFIRSSGPGKITRMTQKREEKMENCSFREQSWDVPLCLFSLALWGKTTCMDVCIGGRRWSREPDGGRESGRRAGSGACILHFPDKAQERFLSMTRHAPRIRGKSRNRTLGTPGFRRKKNYFFSSHHPAQPFNAKLR